MVRGAKVVFRLCSIRILAKNIGDHYYKKKILKFKTWEQRSLKRVKKQESNKPAC